MANTIKTAMTKTTITISAPQMRDLLLGLLAGAGGGVTQPQLWALACAENKELRALARGRNERARRMSSKMFYRVITNLINEGEVVVNRSASDWLRYQMAPAKPLAPGARVGDRVSVTESNPETGEDETYIGYVRAVADGYARLEIGGIEQMSFPLTAPPVVEQPDPHEYEEQVGDLRIVVHTTILPAGYEFEVTDASGSRAARSPARRRRATTSSAPPGASPASSRRGSVGNRRRRRQGGAKKS
jgi:hypothetical protein